MRGVDSAGLMRVNLNCKEAGRHGLHCRCCWCTYTENRAVLVLNSSRATVCFGRNIFILLFVTGLCSMSLCMRMVVYRVDDITMHMRCT
jgi:hypothetical protein